MRRFVWLAALALGIAANASAQAERLSDKDARDLMEAIDKGRDYFVDALDGHQHWGIAILSVGHRQAGFGLRHDDVTII